MQIDIESHGGIVFNLPRGVVNIWRSEKQILRSLRTCRAMSQWCLSIDEIFLFHRPAKVARAI
jgi:hypothetical protein